MDPVTGSLISGGVKLLGGLFGRKKEMSPASKIVSTAKGVRQAADQYGFNPLTLLQNGAMNAGASGGNAPLASNELLIGALEDVTDVVTGEAAQRAAANKLEYELGQLKLDQLRSGVVAVAPSATATVGDGLPALGRRAASVVQSAGSGIGQTQTPFSSALVGDREVSVQPQSNVSGSFTIENPGTFGPVVIPGDGEPWGIDEVATAAVAGAPQVIFNSGAHTWNKMRGPNLPDPNVQFTVDLGSGEVIAGAQGEKSRPSERYDLRQWPFKGLNPFNEVYKR